MTQTETEILNRLHERIARDEILPIVEEHHDELLAEHRAEPFGQCSDELYRVLTFLRREAMTANERHAIMMTRPYEEWTIGLIQRESDDGLKLLDERYDEHEAAEHAVFRKRMRKFREKYGQEHGENL